jgi:hypothetical protein
MLAREKRRETNREKREGVRKGRKREGRVGWGETHEVQGTGP